MRLSLLLAPLLLPVLLWMIASPARADTGSGQRPARIDWLVYGSVLTPPDVFQSMAENSKAEAYFRPQITLCRWDSGAELLAYALIGLHGDRRRLPYNTKAELAAGIEIRRKVTPALRLGLGLRLAGSRQFSSRDLRATLQLTADADVWRMWPPGALAPLLPEDGRLVLSGWGNLRYPASPDPSERDNALVQGALKLAYDIPLGGTKARVSPFVQIKAKWDLQKRPYNNSVEPSVGLALHLPLAKDGGRLGIGLRAARQFRLAGGAHASGVIGFVTWYARF